MPWTGERGLAVNHSAHAHGQTRKKPKSCSNLCPVLRPVNNCSDHRTAAPTRLGHIVQGTRKWYPASGNPAGQLVRSPSPGATSLTLAIEKTRVVSLGISREPVAVVSRSVCAMLRRTRWGVVCWRTSLRQHVLVVRTAPRNPTSVRFAVGLQPQRIEKTRVSESSSALASCGWCRVDRRFHRRRQCVSESA